MEMSKKLTASNQSTFIKMAILSLIVILRYVHIDMFEEVITFQVTTLYWKETSELNPVNHIQRFNNTPPLSCSSLRTTDWLETCIRVQVFEMLQRGSSKEDGLHPF